MWRTVSFPPWISRGQGEIRLETMALSLPAHERRGFLESWWRFGAYLTEVAARSADCRKPSRANNDPHRAKWRATLFLSGEEGCYHVL
jgi:hypothetical protein